MASVLACKAIAGCISTSQDRIGAVGVWTGFEATEMILRPAPPCAECIWLQRPLNGASSYSLRAVSFIDFQYFSISTKAKMKTRHRFHP